MARPNMKWKGDTEVMRGVATLTAGEMQETVVLDCCADAMKVQKLLDKAYIDGARDAQRSMQAIVENAMRECTKKW